MLGFVRYRNKYNRLQYKVHSRREKNTCCDSDSWNHSPCSISWVETKRLKIIVAHHDTTTVVTHYWRTCSTTHFYAVRSPSFDAHAPDEVKIYLPPIDKNTTTSKQNIIVNRPLPGHSNFTARKNMYEILVDWRHVFSLWA